VNKTLIALTLCGSLSVPAVAAANPVQPSMGLDLSGMFMAAPPPSQVGPWPDLDQSVDKVAGGESDAVVIVALESYAFVPTVPGAKANGLAWQRYFTETLGVPVNQVRVLTNTDATKEAIEAALDRAAKQAAAGGRVWFVFIGHGAPSRTGQDGLLLGSDVQRTTDSIEQRSLRHSEVIARLERSAAQPVLVLDACFSGQTAEHESLCEGCQPVGLASLATPKKAIVLSAARADQVAGALPRANRPAFSYLTLGALRGWADADGDGDVTAGEVLAYANTALGAVVTGRSQTPELLGDGGIVLAGSGGESGPDLAKIQWALNHDDAGVVRDDVRSGAAKPGKALVITGGTLTGLGLVTGSLAIVGAFQAANAEDISSLDPEDLSGREDQFIGGSAANTLIIVGSVAAGVLVTTGIALVVTGVRRNKNAARRSAVQTRVVPSFGSGGGGLAVVGQF
jgi:hypothetical protein